MLSPPLVFFWVVEYENGKALPQFDPENGFENRWANVDLKRVRRVGWYPFNFDLASKIKQATGQRVIPSDNPAYTISLKKGDKLILCRRNIIKFDLKDGIKREKTIYVLGKVAGKVFHIHEDGRVEVK